MGRTFEQRNKSRRGRFMIELLARYRRASIRTAAGLTTIAVLAFAPVLLEVAAPAGTNWQKLSDISQTYGSLLSAVALLGVAASLAHQSRQTNMSNEEAQRSSHRELVIMAINDPDLMVCWEPPRIAVTHAEFRQIAFYNLILHNAWADYRLKRTNEGELRVRIERFYEGEIARKHWQGWGDGWRRSMEALGDPRSTRFVMLVDEAYTRAVSAGPPRPSSAYFTPSP
jgi:hypothetical protein